MADLGELVEARVELAGVQLTLLWMSGEACWLVLRGLHKLGYWCVWAVRTGSRGCLLDRISRTKGR